MKIWRKPQLGVLALQKQSPTAKHGQTNKTRIDDKVGSGPTSNKKKGKRSQVEAVYLGKDWDKVFKEVR